MAYRSPNEVLDGVYDPIAKTLAVNATLNATVNVPNPLGVSGTVSIGNLPTSQIITAADGGISTLGSLTDPAAAGDVSGSVNAHVRAVTKMLEDVHDVANHQIRTSASSTPNQGTGNAGSSPWAVSGSVTVLNASSNNQGTGNAGSSPWAVSGSVTVSNALTVSVPNPIGVSGAVTVNSGTVTGSVTTTYTTVVNTSLTRPNNTTTYSANTALANATSSATALTFTSCARGSGGSGVILGAKLLDFTNQTTVLQAELWVYDTTPGTVINDNANWAPVSGDVQNLVGIIPFSLSYVGNNSGTAGTGNVIFEAYNLSLPFKCTSTANLFGQLVVRNAYVPIANELFIVRLDISQD